ncbi:phosphotyrosine protein phosphatase [Brevundimonas sp. LM2]|uniref:low molecular weight protein-tyrosine-phosphatase n=1 Tax=Brevundimonas sp. LM2 TaxID=1938605 RepID=UPI000983E4CA|nr:low molecular weight protein-tyrosine-phosphatase [Brevundimonas sp. LM2]AQR61516.1 phosphotyrosine protein phosphatase [Brevundimonas sp. LM2]
MNSVLFVCLGNICRSPLAEAALRAEAERLRLDLTIESAGTGDWHVGEPPDPRAQAVAARHGLDISAYQTRQVTPADFRRFTHIVALDHDNLSNLRRIAPADATAALSLLLDHVPGREGQAVTDPWFGDAAGFDVTWAEVTAAAAGLAGRLTDPNPRPVATA